MNKRIRKLITILACVALLAVTVLPIRSIHAEDVPGTSDDVQETFNDTDTQDDVLPSDEEGEDVQDDTAGNDVQQDPVAAPAAVPAENVPARSSSVTINAVITDIDGNEIDFSPETLGNQPVAMVSGESTNVQVALQISGMSTIDVTEKELIVTFNGSLFWGNDGSTLGNVPNALDQNKGKKGVTTSTGHATTKYTNATGRWIQQSKTYHVNKETSGFELIFTLGASDYIILENMTDAITVSYREDGVELASTKLENVTNKSPQKFVFSPETGTTINTVLDCPADKAKTTRGHVPRPSKTKTNNSSMLSTLDVINDEGDVMVTFTLDNPNAILKMKGRTGGEPDERLYVFDDSDMENGIYRLRYNENLINTHPYRYNLFYVYFPSEHFEIGDKVTVTSEAQVKLYNPYDENGSVFTNTSQFTYKVVEENSNLELKNKTAKITGNVEAMNYGLGKSSFSELQYFVVNNKGNVPSDPKVLEIRFDHENVGVRDIYLTNVAATPQTMTLTYTTTDHPEKRTVTRELKTHYDSKQPFISGKQTLDLVDDEFLTSLTILFENGFKAGETSVKLYGRVFDDNGTAVHDIQIYDTDDEWNGPSAIKAKLTTTIQRKVGKFYDYVKPVNTFINAGKTGKFTVRLGNETTQSLIMEPVLYLLITTKNEKGEYLEFSNITFKYYVYGATTLVHNNLLEDMDVETYVTDLGRVYKIDTNKLPEVGFDVPRSIVGKDENSPYLFSAIEFGLTLKTTTGTPSQSQKFNTMFYWEDGLMEASGDNVVPEGISNRTTPDGGKYVGGGINMGTSYEIRGISDLVVETWAKHNLSDEWIAWEEGKEAIGIGPKTSFDLMVNVINGSNKAIDGPAYIYVPIPKVGDDWGEMMYQNDEFEFDIKLNSVSIDGETTGLDASNYSIQYGKVTPTDDGNTLNGYTWSDQMTNDTNCVRISVSNLPANEEGTPDIYSFILNCKVDDPEAEELFDTFRPRYFKAVPGLETWSFGSYVSLETALGEVRGQLFLDENMNGKFESGEELEIEGVELTVHDTEDEVVDKVTTDADGKYLFVDLKTKDTYVIKVTNPDTDEYIFTMLGTENMPDSYTTDNQFRSHNDDKEGVSGDVYPRMENPSNNYLTPAVYNAGLLDANTKIKITFDANGGLIGDKEVIELEDKPSAALTAPANPRKDGSFFEHWYLSTEDDHVSATIPHVFGFEELTFIAKYGDRVYTVKYDSNGGTEIEDKTEVKWNDAGLQSSEDPEKTHYVFDGWYVDENLGTRYANQKYSELVENDTVHELTLYAKYVPQEYNITYVDIDADMHSNPATYTIESDEIVFSAPTSNKVGYTFDRWDPESIKSGSSGDKTVTARWITDKYQIEYVLGGGTNHTDNPATYTIEDEVTLKDPSRDGYTFIKWKEGNKIEKNSTGKKTFTAEWKAIEYKIEYDLNKGEGSTDPENHPQQVTKYTIKDSVELKDASRRGYEFLGWLDEEGEYADSIDEGSMGDRKFKADWKPITYTIYFTGGEGAEGEDKEIEAVFDSPCRAPENSFTKESHDFVGWMMIDGGNMVQPDGELKNLADEEGAEVTFVAQWEEFYYEFVSGTGNIWTKGTTSTSDFVVKRSRLDEECTFVSFAGILIDDVYVDPAEFEAKAGSVEIYVKASYLEKNLEPGNHTIEAVFEDGSVKTNFVVRKKPVVASSRPVPKVAYQPPRTGVDVMPGN